MVRAAVVEAPGERCVVVDDIETTVPEPGEVRVAIRSTGVCHSDLSTMTGVLPQPTPFVLGHEAAGDVIEVGSDVDDLAVGDRVIIAWQPPCGACADCQRGQVWLCMTHTYASIANPRFRRNGEPVYGLITAGTFAEQVTLPRASCIRVEDDVPYEVGALIGCGVMTGVGAALNVAEVQEGQSVVVLGIGGVGVAALQGARIAGAGAIVAVDTVESKLADAARFGATHAVTPDQLAEAKQELTGGMGFDVAIECVGHSSTMRSAYDAIRRGGTAVMVGIGARDDKLELNAFELPFMDKTIKGCVYGGADVRTEFHRLVQLWRDGSLDLEAMVSARHDLDGVNDAFDAMRAGTVIRQVINF